MASGESMDMLDKRFYLWMHAPRTIRQKDEGMLWDPWPVRYFKKANDPVFNAADRILDRRKLQCIENFVDPIILLPASSDSCNGVQGGSSGMWVYSLRSPSTLPIRAILWMTPNGKIMLHRGIQSLLFERFLTLWTRTSQEMQGPYRHYHFWNSMNADCQWLKKVPNQLRQAAHQRWWDFNGFRFLDIPLELRKTIIELTVGPVVVPGFLPNRRNKSLALVNLALVNRQIHQEVKQVLFRQTPFHFTSSYRLLFMHPNVLGKIHKIRLGGLTPRDFLHLFGVSLEYGNDMHRYTLDSTTDKASLSIRKELKSLRHIHIDIPHFAEGFRYLALNACQKVYCLAFWAGAKAFLRHVDTVQLGGFISGSQKQYFLNDLRAEKEQATMSSEELAHWQRQTLEKWYG